MAARVMSQYPYPNEPFLQPYYKIGIKHRLDYDTSTKFAMTTHHDLIFEQNNVIHLKSNMAANF